MNRVRNPFNVLFGDVASVPDEVARLFARGAAYAPAVAVPLNVWEDEHALYVEADLPGLDPAALDVNVTEGRTLTIRGERAAPADRTWLRHERPVGTFSRAVMLPTLVDADKVEARYADGVLKLTLPKHDAVKPRKVQVQV